MKSILTLAAAGSMFAGLSIAQQTPHYTVTDLGTPGLGGNFSLAFVVIEDGTVAGLASLPNGKQHAALWQKGLIKDITTPEQAGLNSVANGINERGQASAQAEISEKDPNNENFCLYGTGLRCLPYMWEKGVMRQLPLPKGGQNGITFNINNRGEIVGIAENGTRDPECPAGLARTGTGPQVLDFQAVVWGPKAGDIRELRPAAGDKVGLGMWINDSGQVVGGSGSCANTILPPIAAGVHALLWERDGTPTDLGNLGGDGIEDITLPGIGNIALYISNNGQVTGGSALPGNKIAHPFLWTREKGNDCAPTGLNGCMRDLGLLPGDVLGASLAVSEDGTVVGTSVDATGGQRAFLWKNGVMSDLNTLIPSGSPFASLWFASAINSRGEIVGYGLTNGGDVHGFLAVPAGTTASAGPKNSTVIARQITLDGTASFSADGKPLTYQWSIPQGSPQAAILHGTTATPEVQFASGRNVYTFQVTVTDSTGTSASDLVTVNFQGN